ncbi:TPA: hypothetical protein ACNFJ2_000503 [Escherichia coli]
MTVSTEVDHNEYTGNGVTTTFPYTFRIFQKSDLVVQVVDLNENITELILDTDYIVTGAGGYNGGNVILSKALVNGYQISISRELPVTQDTDLRNQGKFFAEVHEDALDKLTMLIQQVGSMFRMALRKPSSIANWYDALNNYIRNIRDPRDPQDAATKNYVDTLSGSNFNRSLRVPGAINQLPGIEERRNKIVAFDDAGNAIVILPESGTASDVLIELAKPTGATRIGTQSGTVDSFIKTEDYQRIGDVRGFGVIGNNLAPVNDYIAAGVNSRTLKIPRGGWSGNIVLNNSFGVVGDSIMTTAITVPQNVPGISATGAELRGAIISNMSLVVFGAVAGGQPVGSGAGLDLTGVAKAVNCTMSNLYFDYFDIGYKAGPADFSNVYTNIRATGNRIAFEVSSNGQLIENTYINCYAANFKAFALLLRGVKGSKWINFNMGHDGSPNAYFHHIDTNSTGVVFDSPSFEMDKVGGKMTGGTQAVLIASSSEVTYNYPHFNNINASAGNYYHFRCRGSSVTHINNPVILNDDGTAGHLRIEDDAVVYLNDPRGVFTTISIIGNGKLIRVKDKLNNSPDFTSLISVQSGTIVTIGFYPRHVMATCNYSASGVVGSEKYVVIFDTYNSTNGTATARVIDTTTGAVASGITRSVFVQAWK